MSWLGKLAVAFFITIGGIMVWLLTDFSIIWAFGKLHSTPTKEIWLALLFFGTVTGWICLGMAK